MDIEDFTSNKTAESLFSTVLYENIKRYTRSVHVGTEQMKVCLDVIESLMYPYMGPWGYADKKKDLILEYQIKKQRIDAVDIDSLNQAEYLFLKQRFELLMWLIGQSGLTPKQDITEDQE